MPLLCTAGTLATLTPPTSRSPPKRTSWTCAGSPPTAATFFWKNEAISPPTRNLAFFPTTMLTLFELGVTETEASGLPQSPASGPLPIASPRWSPWTWLSSTASISPRRSSSGPRTVRPAS